MKSSAMISLAGIALLALGACMAPTQRNESTAARDKSDPPPGEMEKKGTQTLEDVKRNADNPAGGALIIAPPLGDSK